MTRLGLDQPQVWTRERMLADLQDALDWNDSLLRVEA